MVIPFWLPEGHILKYGNRLMRFEEALGDGILRFRYIDGDEEIVLVPVGRSGELGMPKVAWIICQFRAGVVVDPDYNIDINERNENILKFDRPACIALDKFAGWRFDWADAAVQAGFKKTEADAKYWISKNNKGGRKPQPRSLLRWMRKLVIHGGRIGALVNTSGRAKGQSQLPDIEDRLVHKWAMRYWRPSTLNGRLAHKEDAAALLIADWDMLKEMGVPYLSEEAPSSETVRERINSLECYSTHASRFGRPSADRIYSPSGEPVPVDRPFERIYMDGVEWEHSVFFSNALKIAAVKMKSVISMCAFSSYIFPYPVFAGQFRPVWGLRALRSVMLPPELTPEEIEEDPEAALFYSLPSDVMYDRDRTMIAPRMVPGAIKIFSTAELAEAFHSDAKSKLENYHKFAKQRLAEIPGRILGPRTKYEMGYNPLAATEVTRQQYVDLHEQSRRQWNKTGKKAFGWRSPNDLMRALVQAGGTRLTDPKEVMRTFASTPAKPCVLTNNGLIYDNVHYRFNREGVGKALSSNLHNTPFGSRLKGTAKILVVLRVWDDDIDMIEVFDEENKEFFPMWSTDPLYTGGLNRWEHHIYHSLLRSGAGSSQTKRDRSRIRAKQLNDSQKTLSGKSFREREAPVELLEAEERRQSGKRGFNLNCAQVPELHIPTHIDGAQRNDVAKPPPQRRKEAEVAEGDDDARSDPSKKIARDLGDDEATTNPFNPTWQFPDGSDSYDDDDEED